ncbi:hypothetical protein Cgig2_015192 [Carnegiea gigantea]|uniref:Pentatricopeptide repeat-containing protein n=1 Tax=Carnegiea gigantea TaxID=171969 RepID=A0A9Q1KQI5_9CARY|nr:hypothetical protein Cgig2_015192 [Carnegiea gigantea]
MSIPRRLTAVKFKYPNPGMMSLLQSCNSTPILKQMHSHLITTGQIQDNFLATKLAESFAVAARNVNYAGRIFDQIGSPDSYSWTTMIRGYCEAKNPEKAVHFYAQMRLKGVEENRFTFLFVLKACAMKPRLVEGKMVHGKVLKCGVPAKALELFKEMLLAGISPDSMTITSALSSCAQIGALDMGKWIHAYINQHKIPTDVHLGTALVDMYAKCGDIGTAVHVFCDMTSRNICTWNAILSGLSFHGHGFSALELFKEMDSVGLAPNDVTFVAVLSACSHVGAIDDGRRQFNRMEREFNIVPKIEHYGCMVDILGRGGLMDEAKELIKSMPMQPNIVILGSFLNACKIHGCLEIDSDVVSDLRNLVSEDGGAYVLLSNIFAAKSDWGSVGTVRKLIHEIVPDKKTPGCSSIELNEVVHEFFVEDRSHPKWREINDVIMGLKSLSETEDYA